MTLKFLRKVFICIFLSLISAVLINYNVESAGVSPMVINLEAKPGAERDFQIVLTADKHEEKVNVSLYQLVQLIDGSLNYRKIQDLNSYEPAQWVKLDKRKIILHPGHKKSYQRKSKSPLTGPGDQNSSSYVTDQEGK